MDLALVMDAVGAALETVPGLRVAPYWADRITPPAAVVGWPSPLVYDATYVRGGDRIDDLPVIVLVGKVDARTSRDVLARYLAGSGEHSVKAAIDGYVPAAPRPYHSARVQRAEIEYITVSSVDYLAAKFAVEIIGSGA